MTKRKSTYISREKALAKLQKYCAYQDRCHQEVRSKLLDLGVYGDDLEWIMADLIEDNFLNEERFARSYARGKFRFKHWGRIRIRRELKQRQISDYCLRKAMEEIEEEDYRQTLDQLLRKKGRLLKEKEVFKRNAKLAAFAIRKGYESGLVWELIKALPEVLGEE
ncbi:MAG: regulatory protein RecX [Bacteroidota bacterium]